MCLNIITYIEHLAYDYFLQKRYTQKYDNLKLIKLHPVVLFNISRHFFLINRTKRRHL